MSLRSCGGRSGPAFVESNQALLEPPGHPASRQAVVPPTREIAGGVPARASGAQPIHAARRGLHGTEGGTPATLECGRSHSWLPWALKDDPPGRCPAHAGVALKHLDPAKAQKRSAEVRKERNEPAAGPRRRCLQPRSRSTPRSSSRSS
jgi:hypothetical protein